MCPQRRARHDARAAPQKVCRVIRARCVSRYPCAARGLSPGGCRRGGPGGRGAWGECGRSRNRSARKHQTCSRAERTRDAWTRDARTRAAWAWRTRAQRTSCGQGSAASPPRTTSCSVTFRERLIFQYTSSSKQNQCRHLSAGTSPRLTRCSINSLALLALQST